MAIPLIGDGNTCWRHVVARQASEHDGDFDVLAAVERLRHRFGLVALACLPVFFAPR